MFIKWLAHASFLIMSQNNIRIITDPYHPGRGLNNASPDETADIVTKSHDHDDHNNIRAIKGSPQVLDKAGTQTIKGIDFKAIPVFHDEDEGKQRGKDLIFCFNVDGVNLCHLGDLGHLLNQSQLSEIGPVDVLFIPVGGYFTIDATQATTVAKSLNPRLIFPMHYKTPKIEYPIAGVDNFLEGKNNIRRLNSSEIEITKDDLPAETEIIVLQSAY